MKHLKVNWQTRTLIILAVSIAISLLLVSLELTSWAEQINLQGELHSEGGEGKPNMPAVLKYFLPFVKEIVLICVPLFLTLGLMKLSRRLKRVIAKNKYQS